MDTGPNPIIPKPDAQKASSFPVEPPRMSPQLKIALWIAAGVSVGITLVFLIAAAAVGNLEKAIGNFLR